MTFEKVKIGDKEVMPFTIPSGIITTEPSSLEIIAKEIPQIGILTTKSIGPEPKSGNREPILAQYMPQGFVNAVGLTNPGAKEFAEKISKIKIPHDKFLMVSIFGKDPNEFADVARTLEPFADGFELNLSCPHAKGYGAQIGQDPKMAGDCVYSVRTVTNKPIFAKLTPNTNIIGDIAKECITRGAYGICGPNTFGPGEYTYDGYPVLTNKRGGLSGRGILPLGLRFVSDIVATVGEVPINACGGISNANDIRAYKNAKARYFGIGSALAEMTHDEIKVYFSTLVNDLENGTNNAERLLKTVDMNYRKVTIDEIVNVGCDFKVIQTNYDMRKVNAGQFVFAWIPGIGEKPFSVMDDSPLTLGILERGQFTKAITSLKKGDFFYVRGPYGNSIPNVVPYSIGLVGGGCGIAGLYLIAKQRHGKNEIDIFLAAKDKDHIPYVKEFEWFNDFSRFPVNVHIATEDGSLGKKGLVTDLLKEHSGCDYYFNCGPRRMIDAVLPIQMKHTKPENIYSSVDYMTRCGVGICGSCANDTGLRTCVEGPFMNVKSE